MINNSPNIPEILKYTSFRSNPENSHNRQFPKINPINTNGSSPKYISHTLKDNANNNRAENTNSSGAIIDLFFTSLIAMYKKDRIAIATRIIGIKIAVVTTNMDANNNAVNIPITEYSITLYFCFFANTALEAFSTCSSS